MTSFGDSRSRRFCSTRVVASSGGRGQTLSTTRRCAVRAGEVQAGAACGLPHRAVTASDDDYGWSLHWRPIESVNSGITCVLSVVARKQA
jgi:hypothetical protein